MSKTSRRFFVPEVVQTSGMDCGPACLKALVEGFGTSVSYGRLREACQTDVDGTSIDTLEEVARQLGLDAEQIMVPVDHLLLPEAKTLPAIVVVRLPNGFTHFVVAWGRRGKRIQVMDPATGRRWPTVRQFLDETFVHAQVVPSSGWREWAGTDEFLDVLRQRLAILGISSGNIAQHVDHALADPKWISLAALDAATRMTEALAESGGLGRGRATARFVALALETPEETIPESYWSVRPVQGENQGNENLVLRGAVLVRAKGRRGGAEAADPQAQQSQAQLAPDLAAALSEKPVRPIQELFRLLQADGLLAPVALALSMALAATGVMTEALLFRGLLDLGGQLSTAEQRLGLMIALLVFVVANRLLAYFNHIDALGIGRRLEARLRAAFLAKLPRLGDRYFRSRPVSDMAERAHSLHKLRELGELGRSFFQYFFETLLTGIGMIWIHPRAAPLVIIAVVVAMSIPLIAQPTLRELDLRVRTHLGALAKYYLDALLGLVAVRTHTAERTLRREHENLLGEWIHSKLHWTRLHITMEGIQIFVVLACLAGVVFDYVASSAEVGGLLLLAYWGVNLPFRGRMVVYQVLDYAAKRNVLMRLLEPLGAPEEIGTQDLENAEDSEDSEDSKGRSNAQKPNAQKGGLRIDLEDIRVAAGGHTILDGIHLVAEAGEHIAVVGPSGAGKTSLVGLLLGWHRPSSGRLLIDGKALDNPGLERLRQQIAWVDPSVWIWNRSLLENLRYGNPEVAVPWSSIVDQAQLRSVLELLPEGFQTSLGEGGGLVSGGEGQRVRLGRAMARTGVRLAILDEPFRGLGRGQRHELLGRARQRWAGSTLFCITHDVAETRDFPRVLVVEGGRIVEDDSPAVLEKRPGSRYSALLEAEDRVREVWRTDTWRQMWLEKGRLREKGRPSAEGGKE